MRDYRLWLLRDGPTKRSVVYANSALTAIDDFYTRRGLGKARIDRDELPETAPRALDEQARIRWLRAVEAHLSPRDRTLALIPYYAGARISEVVALDLDDVRLSARKAALRIWGKGSKPRTVQIHKKLRTELDQWLEERPNWPNAGHNPALFLNTKGGRLSARAASGVIHTIARNAALEDEPTAHVLRHTLATTLIGPALGYVSPGPNWTVVPGQRHARNNSRNDHLMPRRSISNVLTCGNALVWTWGHVPERRASYAAARGSPNARG